MNQERRNQIAELVAQKHTIKNAELMERFGISIETVRRDLEYLEQQGCLQRVYGGAVLKTSLGSEPEYNSRAKDHAEEKSSIAMAGARLVEPGDSIFLGVGTTVQAMAQYLKNIPDLTAFTNSLRTAVALSELAECSVVLTGGQLRSKELSLSGFPAEENMLHFNVNKAFLGIGGITEAGVTDFHIGEAKLHRQMIENADQAIILADFSKFGVRGMTNVCPLTAVDIVVTDHRTAPKYVEQLGQLGIQVIQTAS